ncbi:MAG: dTDP-glucose 4,6-dehydratase [Acidimicrobiia bacterium]|nr:dTDP-glucose 4,6-dehydratase [Acidimicrobiia bacterium]
MAVLITGAAGFIGSNLVRHLLKRWPDRDLVSFDLLTYSGHLANLQEVATHRRHQFVQGDVADRGAVRTVLEDHDIDGIIHLAAESHVDRSIVDPMAFVRSNVVGTVVLLQEAARLWRDRTDVRFHHVSTDEVFGSLGDDGAFHEDHPYAPNSPYSASKAASDHFVRAWNETYGVPVVITNCTNNYGPYQFPEKLIPVVISRAIDGDPVPVYGRGANIRDWLYVEDHCDALALVYERGRPGHTYCIGGENTITNIDLVGMILDELDRARSEPIGTSRSLIRFVEDRPGHDYRYAMDIAKIRDELGWSPATDLTTGIAATVRWYLDNEAWMDIVQNEDSQSFADSWYASR